MLGWVFRKGLDGVTGANTAAPANSDDTTQIDIPDTPAPVFAARAIKRTLFGTPAATSELDEKKVKMDQPKEPDANSALDSNTDRSPTKPQGILLTPGTSTTRRKRVTFGYGVKEGMPVDELGPFPSSQDPPSSGGRRRTRLTEALEKSRKSKAKGVAEEEDPFDDEWVEEDDEVCDQDATIDLNEPHSRSGKYWKASFEKYHGEAKSEMEKLVKYKQLAKSYAKMKDAEAVELKMKLKEEQEKVVRMEKEIAELASNMATQLLEGKDGDNPDMMRGLARQTALAVQYREQVKELEAMLEAKEKEDDTESGHRTRRRGFASPRTQKTLLETQRELRRARIQVREIGDLKDRLDHVEKRATRLDEENKRLREESTDTRELERQIKTLKAEIQRKGEEYETLMKEHDHLKGHAKARHGEAQWVVQQRDDKIAELKREVRSLKTTSLDSGKIQRRLDDALLTESAKIIQELKSEVDLLSGSRRRSIAKKVEALNANIKSLGYEPTDLIPSTSDDFILPPPGPSECRESELPDLEPLAKPRRERRTLSLLSGSTKTGTRLVSSWRAPKPSDLPPRPVSATQTSGINREKPGSVVSRLERRWREFVPREERQATAAELEAPTTTNDLDLDWRHVPPPDSPRREASAAEPERDETPKADLMNDRFARLGANAEPNSSVLWTANASKSTLPPDRLSAALARIEQRKLQRLKTLGAVDKENVQPA